MMIGMTEIRQQIDRSRNFLDVTFLFWVFLSGFYLSPSLKLHSFLFYVLCLIYLAKLFIKRDFTIFTSGIYRIIIVFSIYYCLSLFWSTGNDGEIEYFYYIRHVIYVLVFIYMAFEISQQHPQFMERLYHVVFWSAAVSALFSIFWYYSSSHFSFFPFEMARLRYFGYQGNNPIQGAVLHGFAFLVGWLGITIKKTHYKTYAVYLFSMGIILVSIVFTQSRGPILAFLIALTAVLVFTKGDKKTGVLLFVLGLAAVAGLLSSDSLVPNMIARGASHRLEIFKIGIHQFLESPLFGHGSAAEPSIVLENGRRISHFHNIVLSVAFWGGITGVLLLSLTVIRAGVQGIKVFIKDKDMLWIVLLLYGCLYCMTDEHDIFNHPDSLWVIFWLPIIAIIAKELGHKRPSTGKLH